MSCGSSQNLLTSVVERTPKIEKVNVDGGRYIREAKVTIIRSTSFNVGWISFMEYSNYKKVYFFMALYIWTCFFLHCSFVQSGMSNQLVVVKIFHKTFIYGDFNFFSWKVWMSRIEGSSSPAFFSLLVFVSGSSNSLRISEVFRLSQMHDRFRSYTNAYDFY